ncbi:exodeoxyribonuclease III [Tolumonas lignilytica]|uniref:exodeoxyribonuclease III n=1 Tax=Tolumonas lignilytica TaxID=1283284 RepID=UPI000464F41C|nr:exodeoxyribonuclease III [Tolumonas lignilytica]
MKIISFNINGLRARPHQLQAIIEQHNPDIIGLQETKVHDEVFPVSLIEELGYQVHYHGQKAHYGVALLSRQEPETVLKGFPSDDEDAQRRLIIGQFRQDNGRLLTVFNGYFPQGESRDHPVKFPAKQKFYQDLLNYLQQNHTPDEDIVIMGDMNISSTDLDIGIGESNRKRWLQTGKCSFLPEERIWLNALLSWGLVDTWRSQNPDSDQHFSWFDYRSRGFDDNRGLRIDLLLATPVLQQRLHQTGIDYNIRGMEKPSDHAPIWAEFI